jgi:DNA-binding transcriptional LysR family regulator
VRVNILHLRSFYYIAIEGSINQASRRHGVSQSTLSKQLKALEERHKTALFMDRQHPLRLSAAGHDLFARAKSLFDQIEAIELAMGDQEEGGQFSVRIASDSPRLAARLGHELTQAFGQIDLQIRIENAGDTFALLRTGQADLAIVTDPPVHSQFQYIPAFKDHLCAALPLGHPALETSQFDLEWVRSATLLMRESTSRTRASIEKLLLDYNIVPQKQIQLHTRETIREGIALGMGLSFFFSSECPPDERICYRPLNLPVPAPTIMAYLIYPLERKNHPAIKKSAVIVRSF